MKYKVTFKENLAGKVVESTRHCVVESEQQLIDFYGLNEPEIISYKIEKEE